MAKDPALLFYIDAWLVSTKEMKADERGWYLNLILHQCDKGGLPDDIEELANLADVRFSEFEQFKQKWKQVLKQKFKQNSKGRLENDVAKEILRKREEFKEKRSISGKMGYVIKFAIRELGASQEELEYIKSHLNIDEIDTKNKQVLKQVLKQTIKLYINRNRNINNKEKEGMGEKEILDNISPLSVSEITDLYHSVCKSFPVLKFISKARKEKIAIRIKEMSDLETAKTVFEKMEASNFLKGDNDRKWKATFDWVFENSQNWVKIYEGNFDNKTKKENKSFETPKEWEKE